MSYNIEGDNMPSNTFFRLPKEKQDNLIKAAIKEFSNTAYTEASINQIIKEAKIPRGSFYMYFNDKEDLYHYIIENMHTTVKEQFLSLLEKNNGNLFPTFIDFFDYFIYYMESHNPKLFEKIWLNTNYKRARDWSKFLECESQNPAISVFIEKIDQSNLNINNEEDLKYLMEVMIAIVIRDLVIFVSTEIPAEAIKKEYRQHVALLQTGFEKERKDVC